MKEEVEPRTHTQGERNVNLSPHPTPEPSRWEGAFVLGSKCCSGSSHLSSSSADRAPSKQGMETCWCEFPKLSLLKGALCSRRQEGDGGGAGMVTPLSRPGC